MINKAVKYDFLAPAACILKNWHFHLLQAGRQTRPTVSPGGDEVHKEPLWGPGGRRVYEDVAACAPAPVACSQHADTAGSRWWVRREDVFNQRDSASLQRGPGWSQRGWKTERDGILQAS